MLEWAAAANGKVHKKRHASMITWILANISELEHIKTMPWHSRQWALTALRDIDRIGIVESLRLQPPINGVTSSLAHLRAVCKVVGLHFNCVNRRAVISRKPLRIATEPVMLSDLPVDRRGESSPEFGLEIDLNAKPTSLV